MLLGYSLVPGREIASPPILGSLYDYGSSIILSFELCYL